MTDAEIGVEDGADVMEIGVGGLLGSAQVLEFVADVVEGLEEVTEVFEEFLHGRLVPWVRGWRGRVGCRGLLRMRFLWRVGGLTALCCQGIARRRRRHIRRTRGRFAWW